MLQEPMMEKLTAMRLLGMVDALKTQEQDPASRELSFLERLGLLVDQQWTWRENQALARRLHAAKLKGACVEEIDYRASRGLDKSVIRALAQKSAWAAQHENIFVLGPTGVGKSFVACALAQKACRDGYSALYTRAVALFRELALARADGSLRTLLARLSRIDVLVIDDWAMAPLAETERRDFWEICEDRYQTRSTILTSQLPVTRWHEQIADPTAADGILDRLVHNAHRLEMALGSLGPVRRGSGFNAARVATSRRRFRIVDRSTRSDYTSGPRHGWPALRVCGVRKGHPSRARPRRSGPCTAKRPTPRPSAVRGSPNRPSPQTTPARNHQIRNRPPTPDQPNLCPPSPGPKESLIQATLRSLAGRTPLFTYGPQILPVIRPAPIPRFLVIDNESDAVLLHCLTAHLATLVG